MHHLQWYESVKTRAWFRRSKWEGEGLEHPKKYGRFVLASDRASDSFIKVCLIFKVCYCNNKPYMKMN